MVLSLIFIIVLFARFEAMVAAHQQRLWWILLVLFLLADFLFLLVPIRERHSLRYLSATGKIWAGCAWLLVFLFLIIVVPARQLPIRQQHPLILAGAGLLLLLLLGYAIFKLSSSWIRESLRAIVAHEGGGFRVRFEGEEAVANALREIPGAEQSHAGEWLVPANAGSAAALLQFARQYDFDFVPQARSGGEELIRGR
jgi:hypothetical protein